VFITSFNSHKPSHCLANTTSSIFSALSPLPSSTSIVLSFSVLLNVADSVTQYHLLPSLASSNHFHHSSRLLQCAKILQVDHWPQAHAPSTRTSASALVTARCHYPAAHLESFMPCRWRSGFTVLSCNSNAQGTMWRIIGGTVLHLQLNTDSLLM
jgi:hypothetical protein